MNLKRMVTLAASCLALASCSFAISISGASSLPSSSGRTSSSVPSASSSSSGGAMDKTEIAQFYTDFTENNAYLIDSAPTHGTCRMLIIPIWFTDSSTYVLTSKRENVRADIEKTYFGTAAETGWHSVKSFYETESQGRVSISGTVSEWYEVGKSMSAYAPEKSGAVNTANLAVSAKNWYFDTHTGDSPKNYDGDGDGFIDAVMMIYAAPDFRTMNKSSYANLWAYCFWVQDPSEKDVANPGTNAFFWASYDFMYSSTLANTRAGTRYGAGDTTYCNLDAHTFIHEMGHVFGLDDYYDYGPNSYSPAAGFSMQDFNVGGHDPFSTMAFGWSDPYVPTESCQITIGAFQSTHEVVLLTPSWNKYDSPFDEYLLLELYTPTGLNAFDCAHSYNGRYPVGPTVPGIRLWHVDARLLYIEADEAFSANQMTTNALYPSYYGILHAFSNSYGDEDYGSPLGSTYDKYNLLQLIRNDTAISMLTDRELSAGDLFRNGSSFQMSSYQRQFPKGAKLNSGKSLGWSFSVSLTGAGENAKATLNLVKE